MNLLFVAACLLGASNDDCSYADGFEKAAKTNKPMVVVVSTDWCAPCQMMKKKILPLFREKPICRKVVMCYVNPGELPRR